MKQGEKGAWVSIGAYLLLSALKLLVGHFAQSKALFADGLNNATDILASVAVLIGLRIARRPADRSHRYGHYRAETIATMIAGCIMVFVGFDVLLDGGRSLFVGERVVPQPISMWTALFSAGVMLLVYRYNFALGRKINSSALKAAAADNKSDALVSIGAFVGIFGAQFGLFWLDPLTAVIVGLLILHTAYEILKEAVHNLIDGYDEKDLQGMEQVVLAVPDVQEIVDLKARLHGNNTYVDVVIGVDPDLTVRESHAITDEIERQLLALEHVEYVHIHVEPASD
ncbi:MAG TPA: cation diffusion facilitator family transporter [Bacilli bacterium]|nr:cation diffusion facilitator family transporter [Bacilli bacterium]